MVRDQGVGGSNPLSPTNSLGSNNLQRTKKAKHLLAANQGVGRPNQLALNHLSPNYFKQLRRFCGLIFWGGKLAGLANFQTITILKTAGMPDGEAFGMEKVAAFEKHMRRIPSRG